MSHTGNGLDNLAHDPSSKIPISKFAGYSKPIAIVSAQPKCSILMRRRGLIQRELEGLINFALPLAIIIHHELQEINSIQLIEARKHAVSYFG